MRRDLMELLRERSVAHPSRVLATTVTDRQVRVQVIGWPWWKSNADTSRDHAIELVFSGVSDGVLEPLDFDNEFDEALERFSVVETRGTQWALPRGSAIYCNAPLSKPLDVYIAVHDFLSEQGAFRRAEHYINHADTEMLATFIQISQTGSYLLGRFPPALRDVVCAELDAQRVSYTELPVGLEQPGRLLVTIQRSQFFCEGAEAFFED